MTEGSPPSSRKSHQETQRFGSPAPSPGAGPGAGGVSGGTAGGPHGAAAAAPGGLAAWEAQSESRSWLGFDWKTRREVGNRGVQVSHKMDRLVRVWRLSSRFLWFVCVMLVIFEAWYYVGLVLKGS